MLISWLAVRNVDIILTRGELVEDQRFGWDRCSLKGRFKYKQIENQTQIQIQIQNTNTTNNSINANTNIDNKKTIVNTNHDSHLLLAVVPVVHADAQHLLKNCTMGRIANHMLFRQFWYHKISCRLISIKPCPSQSLELPAVSPKARRLKR